MSNQHSRSSGIHKLHCRRHLHEGCTAHHTQLHKKTNINVNNNVLYCAQSMVTTMNTEFSNEFIHTIERRLPKLRYRVYFFRKGKRFELPVEQSTPVYPFWHSHIPLERQSPRPLQLLGQEPARNIVSQKLFQITKFVVSSYIWST